jgi:hypothetical protein
MVMPQPVGGMVGSGSCLQANKPKASIKISMFFILIVLILLFKIKGYIT